MFKVTVWNALTMETLFSKFVFGEDKAEQMATAYWSDVSHSTYEQCQFVPQLRE